MRIVIIALVAVVSGVAVGIVSARWELVGVPEHFERAKSDAAAVDAATPEQPVCQVLNGIKFDFGMLAPNESGEHQFRISNHGRLDLDLEFLERSCGLCIESDFDRAVVASNETIEVPVTYTAKKPGPEFNEFIELKTNDPGRPVVRLTITGMISDRVRLSVNELQLESISSNQETVAGFRVYSFLSDELRLRDFVFADDKIAEHFEISSEPLDVSELPMRPRPRSACAVTLRIKPGLPVGQIRQSIRFVAEADVPVELEVPLTGSVMSDVSIFGGRAFDRHASVLQMGQVAKEKGASARLQVLVKGESRESIQLSIGEIDPDVLQVTLGEPREIRDGAVLMYPLDIKIPAGSRTVNRLGFKSNPAAKFLVHSTHPDAKEIAVYVRFAIE